VSQVLEVFGDIRANVGAEFDSLFEMSQQMISAIGSDTIKTPRTAGRHTARVNLPAVGVVEYCHHSLFFAIC
jgi:hypothetical protein